MANEIFNNPLPVKRARFNVETNKWEPEIEPKTSREIEVTIKGKVPPTTYSEAILDSSAELGRALSVHPIPAHSAHEAFAILLEEVDELKVHVWTNQKKRDIQAMRKEAIQVAAMAIRFAAEVCNEEVGRK